ncbi:MAG: DUF1667 domain-containing protein [Lachnospiraceae bacterium]|nr:DUF1667 domain-containing protein [Lachnospiraceae bacterium]
MERKLTCIVCPLGCSLTVQIENGVVTDVQGNTCPRGKVYAENECTNPVRTITSTMKCSDGSVISVKTDRTIPKDKMTKCMEIINQNTVKLPISIGDVIIKDVFGSNIVATQNRSTNE